VEEEVVKTLELFDIVHSVPGYAEITRKEYDYVMEEAGFKDRKDVNLDEFIEICGALKDVALAPIPKQNKRKRLSIPVEKSGGGV